MIEGMGMFSWLRRPGRRSGSARSSDSSSGKPPRGKVADDLAEWAQRRRGVEVYVEPKTAVTGTSVVLVAHDGEFTRRRISSPKAAQKFAHAHQLPIYDAMIVGYPQRMRDYSRRQTILRERERRAAIDDQH